jgi:hypothetical protein
MNPRDLNRAHIATDSGPAWDFSDHSADNQSGTVSLYLRNLECKLISHIRQASLVVGCIAWLTNRRILQALAQVRDGVALVVQKEDFLRPDLGTTDSWRAELRTMYNRLKTPPERHCWPSRVASLSVCCDPTMSPVRCVGNYNRDKKPAFPRMHHKFLVFCRSRITSDDLDFSFHVEPYEVWTGSFNFTENAVMSLENALVLRDREVVVAFFREWQQIEALSEPLDWHADWSAPEWRIGT